MQRTGHASAVSAVLSHRISTCNVNGSIGQGQFDQYVHRGSSHPQRMSQNFDVYGYVDVVKQNWRDAAATLISIPKENLTKSLM